MDEQGRPHVAIIPSPGMGHLIPLVEFAKLLVARFGFSISFILPSPAGPTPGQLSVLGSLPASISHTFLDPVDPALLPNGAPHGVTIGLVHHHSLPTVQAELSGLLARRAQVAALMVDLFGWEYLSVARELGVRPYVYYTASAMSLLFSLNLPRLDKTVSCDYQDMPSPLVLPGCVPLWGNDFDEPSLDRKGEAYMQKLERVKKYVLAEGIFVNTFLDLEPGAIRGLDDPDWPPVYPVGPIIQSAGRGESDGGSECLEWLDRQPVGSVLFVSFGSGGTLSKEQLVELAIGLEKSGERFLWVVRSPDDHSSYGSFFTTQSQDDPYGFLPYGYLDRIKDRGLLIPSWATQIKILSHGSTGGFLTHCGWNSVLESIINRVPLIAWPLYAEQRMNAVMLNEGLKVALRPNPNERGLNEADEIARVVKELMEGENGKQARHRVKELSDLAKQAISSEDGSSSKLLAHITDQWRETCLSIIDK